MSTRTKEKPPDIDPQEAVDELIAIRKLADECAAAEAEYEEAKDAAKEAKESLDQKWSALTARCRNREKLPLFSQNGSADAWRQTPIREVLSGRITDKKIQLLEEAEIKTLGELEDFRAAKGERGDWGIKGIGVEMRTKIEDGVLTWLDNWRRDQDKAREKAEKNGQPDVANAE